MWIETSQLKQGGNGLSADDNYQVYNGLDCCLTTEILHELKRVYGPSEEHWKGIYNFERALQGPYLEIMQRGFKVDEIGRRQASRELTVRIEALTRTVNELAEAVWDKRYKDK